MAPLIPATSLQRESACGPIIVLLVGMGGRATRCSSVEIYVQAAPDALPPIPAPHPLPGAVRGGARWAQTRRTCTLPVAVSRRARTPRCSTRAPRAVGRRPPRACTGHHASTGRRAQAGCWLYDPWLKQLRGRRCPTAESAGAWAPRPPSRRCRHRLLRPSCRRSGSRPPQSTPRPLRPVTASQPS